MEKKLPCIDCLIYPICLASINSYKKESVNDQAINLRRISEKCPEIFNYLFNTREAATLRIPEKRRLAFIKHFSITVKTTNR